MSPIVLEFSHFKVHVRLVLTLWNTKWLTKVLCKQRLLKILQVSVELFFWWGIHLKVICYKIFVGLFVWNREKWDWSIMLDFLQSSVRWIVGDKIISTFSEQQIQCYFYLILLMMWLNMNRIQRISTLVYFGFHHVNKMAIGTAWNYLSKSHGSPSFLHLISSLLLCSGVTLLSSTMVS